jgi:AbrB family looped-hinge helix DNA binding protein
MEQVTISSKFQIVLPKWVRHLFGTIPGQKLLVIVDKNRIVLVPDQPIHASRGALKGMDISVERDEADRI